MTVLVLGRGRPASEFAVACEYAGRNWVRLDPAAHRERDAAQAAQVLATMVRDHQIRAIVDGTAPFAEAAFAEACYVVAHAHRVPVVRAPDPAYATPTSRPDWAWVDTIDELVNEVVIRGLQSLVMDVSPSLGAQLDRLVLPTRRVHWGALVADPRAGRRGRNATSLQHAVAVLREAAADGVAVADDGDPRTHTLLAGAEQRGLRVVAVRRPEPWRSFADGVVIREAWDALSVAEWIGELEQAR